MHVEFLLPPAINTEGQILIQSAGPALSAHPLGNVAGPVTEGQFRQSPAQPIQPMPMGVPVPPRSALIGDCIPSGYPSRLTVEEWIRLKTASGESGKGNTQ